MAPKQLNVPFGSILGQAQRDADALQARRAAAQEIRAIVEARNAEVE